MFKLETLTPEQLIVIIKHLEKRLWEEGVSGDYFYAGAPTEEEYYKELVEEYKKL